MSTSDSCGTEPALQPGTDPPEGDDPLVRATRARLRVADARRLEQLSAKSEQGTLTPEELTEYQALAERAEELDVARAEALAEFVRRRRQPVDQVMRDIGWESGPRRSSGPYMGARVSFGHG